MSSTRAQGIVPSSNFGTHAVRGVPLHVVVVWHPDDSTGKKVFETLLDHYHSDAFSGLVGGSIEVYARSTPWNDHSLAPRPVLESGMEQAQLTVIIPVLSTELDKAARDNSEWDTYLTRLLSLKKQPPQGAQVLLCPVQSGQVNPCSQVLDDLKKMQVVQYNDSSDEQSFSSRVSQAITQKLFSDAHPERISVFISHTKHLTSCEQSTFDLVWDTIRRTTLKEFFDAHDIQAAEEWAERIEVEASSSNSALLVVRTDLYSSRYWTQREVRLAKTNDVPIVALSALSEGDQRGCFLMDNVPTLPYPATGSTADDKERRRAIIKALDRLVDECLKRAIWKLSANSYEQANFDWCPTRPPEPVTIVNWLRKKQAENIPDNHLWILHPDPPITTEEWDALSDIRDLSGLSTSGLTIVSPREFESRAGVTSSQNDPHMQVGTTSLSSTRVGISVSHPSEPDLLRFGFSTRHIDLAVTEIARYVFIQGGSLTYGGTLVGADQPRDLTLLLSQEAGRYGKGVAELAKKQRSKPERRAVFENFFPWSVMTDAGKVAGLDALKDSLHPDGDVHVVTPEGEPICLKDAITKSSKGDFAEADQVRSLSALRKVLVDRADLRLAIGGPVTKAEPSPDWVPGILEEAWLTAKAGKPLFIAGGFGGAARLIAEYLDIAPETKLLSSQDTLPERGKEMLSELKYLWAPAIAPLTGLREDEIKRLATESRPYAIASAILQGHSRGNRGTQPPSATD